MTQEELQEKLERYRRFGIHLVKPARTQWMYNLDQEIYYGKTQETQK